MEKLKSLLMLAFIVTCLGSPLAWKVLHKNVAFKRIPIWTICTVPEEDRMNCPGIAYRFPVGKIKFPDGQTPRTERGERYVCEWWVRRLGPIQYRTEHDELTCWRGDKRKTPRRSRRF